MKGFILALSHRMAIDFCKDVYFIPTDYVIITKIDDILGRRAAGYPVYIVADSFNSSDWYKLRTHIYTINFIREASVVLRPILQSKWS